MFNLGEVDTPVNYSTGKKNISNKTTNNESRLKDKLLKYFSNVHQVMAFSFKCRGCTYLFTRLKHPLLYEFPVSERKSCTVMHCILKCAGA